MKLSTLSILCTASLLLLSGCVSAVPKPKDKAVIDPSLPVVTLTKNGIMRDMKSVAFEWQSITDSRVNAIYIYKRDIADSKDTKLHYFATINNRFQTHFVDTNGQPNQKYFYAFKVGAKKVEGKLSQVYSVNTLPLLHSVAWIHSIQGLPRMAKIIWRPHQSERVEKYIIERKTYDSDKWREITTLEGRLNAEYIDMGLEDSHLYLYRVRVATFDGLVSKPSEVVRVITKALPKSIAQIEATNNLPREIDIKWNKSNAKDFARYYLYRSDSSDGNYELIAKLYNNHFKDKIDTDGKSYFYRVSVVDKDGLESKKDAYTATGMTLSKPLAPTVIEVLLTGNRVRLSWEKNDKRAKYYKVEKEHKEGWFEEQIKRYAPINGNVFFDSDIKPNTTYIYRVYSVDANGIVSNPSSEVKVVTPIASNSVENPVESKVEKVVPKRVEKRSKTEEKISPVKDLDLNEI